MTDMIVETFASKTGRESSLFSQNPDRDGGIGLERGVHEMAAEPTSDAKELCSRLDVTSDYWAGEANLLDPYSRNSRKLFVTFRHVGGLVLVLTRIGGFCGSISHALLAVADNQNFAPEVVREFLRSMGADDLLVLVAELEELMQRRQPSRASVQASFEYYREDNLQALEDHTTLTLQQAALWFAEERNRRAESPIDTAPQ